MRTRVGVSILLMILCAAAVLALSPGDSTESGAVAVAPAGPSAPGTAGMRAYLDPETGKVAQGVVPNTAIALDPQTQNALRHDDQGLEIVRHANGAISVNVQDRYQEASIIHIDKNGKSFICTNNSAEMERVLNEKTSVPTTPEVK